MNAKNLKIIVNNYISKFDQILRDGEQSYLWRTAAGFKILADDAVNSSEEEFTDKLFRLCEYSKSSIDGKFIQPMNSINDFAAREPETVRHLLKSLFAEDWGNMNLRRNKIAAFVCGCNNLHDKYFPCNVRYYMTPGKALSILSVYDPDCCYMYQESPARLFAQCTGFEGNWGSGNDFEYSVYSEMCDELTEYIRSNQQLIFTSCGRYAQEEGLHADMNYHLLAYDIILCNAKYKLYEGIRFSSRILEENKAFHRHQQEALVCFRKYRAAWEKNLELTKGHISFMAMVRPKTRVSHVKMGEGVVETIEGENAVISFGDEGCKKFNMLQTVLNGFIKIENDGFEEWKDRFGAVMVRKNEIQNQLETAAGMLEERISLLWGV